ncbi:hypothetical protein VMCG_09925 [Cytospora schulzeri]|uniref:Heterokaryon incompatibility domain-containing protein n=1 Tax=Cytospora schulzeri TaxID=448051 RepID=A0A423VFA3_9PEZI|nr:hypothetical protein VMCG_09925 [Valsa malicola]
MLNYNVHARLDFKTHVTTWDWEDGETENRNWLQAIRPGDMIQIVPRAQYPMWVNYVREAKIEMWVEMIQGDLSWGDSGLAELIEANQSTYQCYRPLTGTKKRIRVVDLHPAQYPSSPLRMQLRYESLERDEAEVQANPLTYDALSYCWGSHSSQEPLSVELSIDGMNVEKALSFVVTPNLYAALTQLRLRDQIRTLWIDYICINQTDMGERGEQVALMGEIFENAESVQVWLGDSNEEIDEDCDLIRKISQHYQQADKSLPVDASEAHQYLPAEHNHVLHAHFNRIFRKSWFGRIWVLQEAWKARKISILCGSHILDWNDIVQANQSEGISQFKWLWFNQPRELADLERLDKASRGTWGSFLLLITRVPRLNAIWLANLGAVITIAALAVDPFSQQIIQSEPCLWNVTGVTAEIPKMQNYEARITTPSNKPRITGSMQGAIYMGLLAPPQNSSAAITASCRTGNCTFPHDDGAAFSTLAMCQSCSDISDTITYGTSEIYDDRPATIPSGANPHDFAIACGMTPCLKTFSANVTDTVYEETELSSQDLVWSSHAGYTLATNTTLRNGTWEACMPTPQNTSTNTLRINTTSMALISEVSDKGIEWAVSSNIDIHNISAGASLWYPDDCVWWFGTLPADAISSHLLGIFDNKTLDTPYWSRAPSSAQGDLWLVNLYRNGTMNMDTVNAYMNGLAWSMTANMRQSSEDSILLRTVQGQMKKVESCLTVRWVWLSLPASLLGLELSFLVTIMVLSRSAKHWRGDWKDSSLALLYHGLEDHTAKYNDGGVVSEKLLDKEGMFKVAQGTRVQLQKGDGNWRFCKVI